MKHDKTKVTTCRFQFKVNHGVRTQKHINIPETLFFSCCCGLMDRAVDREDSGTASIVMEPGLPQGAHMVSKQAGGATEAAHI